MIIERRIAERYRAVDGALAALSPVYGRVGQIQNISLNGLAFRYIAEDSPMPALNPTVTLQILFAGEGVWIEGIPAKWVADIDLPPDRSFSGIPLRQTSVQFLNLTDAQKARLEEFIRRFTNINN